MAYFVNLGYRFKLPESVVPDGSVILCSAMPMHQLERRRFDKTYPHLEKRLFDPQLYLAGLDAAESKKHCAYLASYPWFGVQGLQEYESSLHTQNDWKKLAEQTIVTRWLQSPPSKPNAVTDAVKECVDFQIRLDCQHITLPSPLTAEPSTSYSDELLWLDIAIDYVKKKKDFDTPIFATIALTDLCLRYTDPLSNTLLDLILDSISAREVDGVYIVVEQGSEAADTRHCGNRRTLQSVLHLTHLLVEDCGLRVAVNFFGQFGLACEAAGADIWASGWYKSVYRLRIADKLGGGRAFPSYWTNKAVTDIHLQDDFDKLNNAWVLSSVAETTPASSGLLSAAQRGVSVDNIPAWRYAQSNIEAAREHFFLSSIQAEQEHESKTNRLDFVENWLCTAAANASRIDNALGNSPKTKTTHIQAWLDAFLGFRRDHNV